MTERKEFGKIRHAEFGLGGYQDAQLGIGFELGGDGWGANDFWGHWGTDRSKNADWSESDRVATLGKTAMRIKDILDAAQKQHVSQLKGVPVEVTFEGNVLKSWRVLTEVI